MRNSFSTETRHAAPALRRLIAVALLTASQFTALPFISMVAANSRHHDAALQAGHDNMTVVYKTAGGQHIETM